MCGSFVLSQEKDTMMEITVVAMLAIFSLAVVAIVAMVQTPGVAKKALDILLGFWRNKPK